MNINPQQESSVSSQLISDNGSGDHPTDISAMINLTEARKILGVSPNTMSKLVTDGTLQYAVDPLDQRVKLVPRADVERLKQYSRKP
jgi:hypothetical protein